MKTSVSETIRNPSIVEAQNAVGIRPRTIFNMAAVRHLEL